MIVKVAVVPVRIVTLEGMPTTPLGEPTRLTTTPPSGAGADRVTVPFIVLLIPRLGKSVARVIAGAITFTCAIPLV